MAKQLLIGVNESGVMETDAVPDYDLETKFRMARESGIFDYFDKTPPADKVNTYAKLAEKYDLPVLAGGWYYVLGQDESTSDVYGMNKVAFNEGHVDRQFSLDEAAGTIAIQVKRMWGAATASC